MICSKSLQRTEVKEVGHQFSASFLTLLVKCLQTVKQGATGNHLLTC